MQFYEQDISYTQTISWLG